MVLGTASHVGKSILATALCRILANDGYRVAPFKAQNMSLNSAATPEGLEIGRAQALQAEAARVAASVDMNPILLKPTSDASSQVVVLGRSRGVERAADYHLKRTLDYFPLVVAAYERLAAAHDVIVLEGAGSPAEINLRETDIVNMRMAQAADARCLLVGDIDRGGVFAALLGTLDLLEPHERARITAFAINKFRGDPTLLAPGVVAIERRVDVPCAGVIPWLPDLGLDEEDSVAFDDARFVGARPWRTKHGDPSRRLRVAIVALPFLSNGTDFAALDAEPEVDVAYARTPADLAHADVTILPGTKETLAALRWLRETRFDDAILAFSARGGLLVGICGGMQILGRHVADPFEVEGGGRADGLGLLDLQTELARGKVTELVTVRPRPGAFFGARGGPIDGPGYEIHMGRSTAGNRDAAFATFERRGGVRVDDGQVANDSRTIGTYAHGLFSGDALRHAFVRAARERRGLRAPHHLARYGEERDARFERLAAHVRGALSLERLLPA
jgi:adenosylcobyric acid synthase